MTNVPLLKEKELPLQCLDRRPNLLLHYEGGLLFFLPIGFWVFVE